MICATVHCPLSSTVQSVSHPQLGCALLYLPWLHCSYVVIHGIKYNKVFPSIMDRKHQVRAGTGIQGQDISWIRESYNLLSVGWQEHDYESVCSQLKNKHPSMSSLLLCGSLPVFNAMITNFWPSTFDFLFVLTLTENTISFIPKLWGQKTKTHILTSWCPTIKW